MGEDDDGDGIDDGGGDDCDDEVAMTDQPRRLSGSKRQDYRHNG